MLKTALGLSKKVFYSSQNFNITKRAFGGGGFDNHNGLYPNRLAIYGGAIYTDDLVPTKEQGLSQSNMHQIQKKGGFQPFIASQQNALAEQASYQENLQAMSDYLSSISLRPALQKAQFYRAIAQKREGDHPELVKVKDMIQKLVNDQLAYLGYKNQVSKQQNSALVQKTMNEVTKKSNFYFSFDMNKASENLQQFDKKAPGNSFRVPSKIMPHQHIDIQNYIDVKSLTQEKIDQILTYYTFLVDLHIGQIRPSNITEKQYIPSQYDMTKGAQAQMFQTLQNHNFDYYYRFRKNPNPLVLQTQHINFQKSKDNQPLSDHPEGKWFPTDVEWTDQQKFPHVATRLGHPILSFQEWERILGFEYAPSHQGYQLQPFVKTPPLDPDPDVNFQLGETIYENTKITEWIRLWKFLWLSLPLAPIFYAYEFWCNSGFPSMQWASANLLFAGNAPRQFQDTVDLDLYEYRYPDEDDYMNVQYSLKRGFLRPANALYMYTSFLLFPMLHFNYATKVVYNRDKDLVFVYRLKGFMNETQQVYETAHLQQVVPNPTTSWKDLSQIHDGDNGIITVTCLNSHNQIKLYGDDKYWNLDEKKRFMRETRNLWRKVVDGKRGMFLTGSKHEFKNSPDQEKQIKKVVQGIQSAVVKYGEVQSRKQYMEWSKQKVQEQRKNIAINAGVR